MTGSSDVCSSDLLATADAERLEVERRSSEDTAGREQLKQE